MTGRDRLHVLRRLFRDQRGPITTGMVHTLYRNSGLAPSRTTARADLKTLVNEGLIYATGPTSNRKYWLKQTGTTT